MLRLMIGRIIETEATWPKGPSIWPALPAHGACLCLTGDLPLRRRADGFAELLNAIISQQVSVASAGAVQGRMEAAGLTDPRRSSRRATRRCAPRV